MQKEHVQSYPSLTLDTMESKAVHLVQYVNEGTVGPQHFDIRTTTVDISPEALQDGDVAVKALVISPDPYLRGQIRATNMFSGTPNEIQLGDVLKGFVVVKVIASKNAALPEGTLLGASLPYKTVQIVTRAALQATVSWNLTPHITEEQASLGVGVLGMPGSTAYGGLLDVLRPNAGEVLFVSGAAGAVGGLVGMLAKSLFNCTVIGSCGGPAKCQLVKEKYGFDHAIDYKTVGSTEELVAKLKEVAPNGIDMYYDNVGGMHFEAAFRSLRPKGRIAVCGGISSYDEAVVKPLAFNPLQMIYTFQRVEGFVCFPWLAGLRGNFLGDMTKYLHEKKIPHVEETVFQGIESWAEAFRALFVGANTGKVVIKV